MLGTIRAAAPSRRLASLLVILAILAACGTQAITPTPIPSPSAASTVSSPSPTPTDVPTPTAVPTANPFASRRVTLLILGSDSNPTRLRSGEGKLTDSIIVLSVNKGSTRVSMISVPRDMVDVPLGNGGTWRQKINAVPYYLGEAAMKRAIAALIGQPIDYFVEINMPDFGHMVDAIGGVDVRVPQTIVDPSIGLSITAGLHHMNGNLALSFARSRHTTSDWDRAARQQLLVAAIIRKMVDPNTKINFLQLLSAMKSMITDLPLSKFSALFELARASAKATVVTQVLAPPRYATFSGIDPGGRGYVEEPALGAIRAYAASVMRP